ncbi:hypothetical protein [Sagittula stellata]|uniref:Uncharacterized protein n=1 Tax=Sagittula stellata (strain ATCC 700073 / DSM 11524 / E-37) TaxID=388399 RepID=A3JYJ1_SAGS3|nr:hypothetical protein [Sagittula stellata]EBA09544.1 hypothetical protein SSE37_07048 [Sagittula stellata E-37]
MSAPTRIDRPELTLPEAEAALLREAYRRASVILEYGSGGSTVMAAEMPGKTVFSVESDQDWAHMMRGWFADNPPAQGSTVEVVWSDIGATKEWGHPVDHTEWRRFARYPLEVWSRSDFRQPQVVLVDGRFRQGCALACAFMSGDPLDLYFDDYVQRQHYHKVEEILGPPKIIGRMAHFHVPPRPIPPERLMWIIKLMQSP